MQSLKEYLKSNYKASSVKTYLREIELYLQSNPQAQTATYKDITNYLNEQRKTQKASSIQRILQSIKKYYNYLVEAEIREDNPTQYLKIKDHKKKHKSIHNQLLSMEELQELWEHFRTRKLRQEGNRIRNLVLLSLLFFQALRAGEIKALNLENIDLDKGEIDIPSLGKNRARTLPLDKKQLLLFYEYIHIYRKNYPLINPKEKALFISRKGKREQGETLHTLIKSERHYFNPIALNPNLIRQSVIAQKFAEGLGLQAVQYSAGHRYPSSTERYKSDDLQALKIGILKHHPLQ